MQGLRRRLFAVPRGPSARRDGKQRFKRIADLSVKKAGMEPRASGAAARNRSKKKKPDGSQTPGDLPVEKGRLEMLRAKKAGFFGLPRREVCVAQENDRAGPTEENTHLRSCRRRGRYPSHVVRPVRGRRCNACRWCHHVLAPDTVMRAKVPDCAKGTLSLWARTPRIWHFISRFVCDADDIVLAQVGTSLNLDQLQHDLARVAQAMYRPLGDVD